MVSIMRNDSGMGCGFAGRPCRRQPSPAISLRGSFRYLETIGTMPFYATSFGEVSSRNDADERRLPARPS
jgi:hypothetical protein